MKPLYYIGKIDQSGRLTGPAAGRIREELRAEFAGQFVQIVVTGWVNPVSRGKRAEYFQEIIPAILAGLRDLGNDVNPRNRLHQEQCHEMLMGLFLEGQEVLDANGKVITLPPSTKEMSDEAFKRYIDRIYIWAGENLGLSFTPKKTRQ